MFEYWWESLNHKPRQVSFNGKGWTVSSGDFEADITAENITRVLSDHALLVSDGKTKLLTCGCKPDPAKKHRCKRCKCGKRGQDCVLGYCACYAVCTNVDDVIHLEPLLAQGARAEGAAGRRFTAGDFEGPVSDGEGLACSINYLRNVPAKVAWRA